MGHFKELSVKKFKKPKISADKANFRIFVRFLPQYQKTKDGTFNYLTDDYNLNKPLQGYEKLHKKLFDPNNPSGLVGKFSVAMLYDRRGKEEKCIGVRVRGINRKLTYEEYKSLPLQKDGVKNFFRCWVLLKPGTLRNYTEKYEEKSSLNWKSIDEDHARNVFGKDAALFNFRQSLLQQEIKHSFSKAIIFDAETNEAVASFNHLGHLKIKCPILKAEAMSLENYYPYELGIFA